MVLPTLSMYLNNFYFVSAATTASTAPTVSASNRELTSSDDETIIQADSRVDNGIDN